MKGYRTLIIAALVAIVGALQGLNWVDLLPTDQQAVGWVTTGLGAIMAVLRMLTNTSAASKT